MSFGTAVIWVLGTILAISGVAFLIFRKEFRSEDNAGSQGTGTDHNPEPSISNANAYLGANSASSD
ncbi:MAG: hypothetical protein AAFR19_18390 [Pseudomonadota bacterium]